MRECFILHGVTIAANTSDGEIARQLMRFLKHFGLAPMDVRLPDVTIALETGEVPQAPEDGWREVPKAGFSVRMRGDEVDVRNEQAVLVIHPRTGEVTGVVDDGLAGQDHLNMNLVSYALLTVLRHHGLYPMHAASLAFGDRGVLIVADSGAGKSTLAAALLECGWSVVSDDSLLLRYGTDGIEALALRRDLFLMPDSTLLNSAAEQGGWPNTGKVRFDPSARFPDQTVDFCVPRLAVFPEIVDRFQSRLRACAPVEGLHLLAHHGLVAEMEPSAAVRNMEILRDLTVQSTCRKLEAGRDVLTEPAVVAGLLLRA